MDVVEMFVGALGLIMLSEGGGGRSAWVLTGVDSGNGQKTFMVIESKKTVYNDSMRTC